MKETKTKEVRAMELLEQWRHEDDANRAVMMVAFSVEDPEHFDLSCLFEGSEKKLAAALAIALANNPEVVGVLKTALSTRPIKDTISLN